MSRWTKWAMNDTIWVGLGFIPWWKEKESGQKSTGGLPNIRAQGVNGNYVVKNLVGLRLSEPFTEPSHYLGRC
jgi:hypothetical protein